ncbi:MAG: MurR/RpiR family transcriptional regulator [Alphaproteobacteria bacterium]|jgi:DNA-binding MurR/RpiR family transcriptional regulator|nr:MurR/RpiR family transcriptional regulator [Alphaproteobacteria bacterium]
MSNILFKVNEYCIYKVKGEKMSILQSIKNQKDLTTREQMVADYILEHSDKVVYTTVTSLAEATSTSLATVLRLIKKLGYKTFGEFKLALAIDLVESKKHENHYSKTLIEEILDSINFTKENLDYKKLQETANTLSLATKIILCGYGVSYAVAYFLYFKFIKLGLPAVLVSNSYEAEAITPNENNNEVAILISGSGSSRNILNFARSFKETNNTVIALTNMPKSPLEILCDYVLVGGIPDSQLNSGAASSRIPIIIICEYLIQILTENPKLKDNMTKNNRKLSQKEF